MRDPLSRLRVRTALWEPEEEDRQWAGGQFAGGSKEAA